MFLVCRCSNAFIVSCFCGWLQGRSYHNFLTAVSMAGCEGALGSPIEVALSAARKFEPKSYRLAVHFRMPFVKGYEHL